MISRTSCCHHSTIWLLVSSSWFPFKTKKTKTKQSSVSLLLLLFTVKSFGIHFTPRNKFHEISLSNFNFKVMWISPTVCWDQERGYVSLVKACNFSCEECTILDERGHTSERSQFSNGAMNRSNSNVVVCVHLVNLTCWSQCACPSFRTSRTRHEGTTSPLTAGSAPSDLRGFGPPVGQQVRSSEV